VNASAGRAGPMESKEAQQQWGEHQGWGRQMEVTTTTPEKC